MSFNQAGETVIHRIPVAAPLIDRAPPVSGYDSFLVNCFFEKTPDGKTWIIKRPGKATAYSYAGGGASNGQNLTYYNGNLYAIGSNILYRLIGSSANAYSVGNAWTNPGNATWAARYAFACFVFQNQIFVVGGYDGTRYYNDVWSSPDGTTWTQVVGSSPWGARGRQKAVVYNNQIYLMGGSDAASFYNDVWVSPDGLNWTQLTAAASWTARTNFGLVSFNNGMYLYGGADSGGVQYNDVWYSTDGISWARVAATTAWAAVNDFGFCVHNNYMWKVGGYDGAAAVATVYYSADGITWTAATNIPAARYGCQCVSYAGRIWVLGGFNGGYFNTVYSSADGVAWTTQTAASWTAMMQFGCVVFKSPTSASATNAPVIWVLGGFTAAAQKYLYYTQADGSLSSSWNLTTTGSTSEQWQTVTVNNNQYLCMKNTYDLYTLYAAQVTRVADPNYPTRTVPGIVNLDSTVYVMDSAGVIYGCDLSTPTVWGSLNFITAEYEGDQGVCLAKVQNYVVALKQNTTQFFYDAGTAQGSALLPIKNANIRIGCASAGSVVAMDNTLVFMAQTFQYGRSIVMLNGFSPVKVSTPFIDRLLDAESSPSTVTSFDVKNDGHEFYVLNLTSSNKTVVYDLVEKEWAMWTDSTGTSYYDANNYATDGTSIFLQRTTAGFVDIMSPSFYTDHNNTIPVSGQTTILDFNSTQRKFMGELTLVGDKASSANAVTVTWSDDNCITFNSGQSVDMSSLRPRINRMGSFYRRIFHFAHSANMPLRLEAYEFQILPGDI